MSHNKNNKDEENSYIFWKKAFIVQLLKLALYQNLMIKLRIVNI